LNFLVRCGFQAVVTDVPQVLNSPGWPRSFPTHQACVWILSAANNDRYVML